MSTKDSNTSQELFNLNGKPSFGQALPLAFQHVVAMIIGCVAPAIILAGVSGLSESDTVVLIQASLAMSAISTFIQLFPFIKFKSYQIGAGLPVIMGISFAYVPIMQSIAQDADVGTILGAQIVGGIVAIIVGIFIKQIRHLFPAAGYGNGCICNRTFAVSDRSQLYGRWSRKCGLWFMAELACCDHHTGSRNRTESFWKGLFKAFFRSDRNHSWICSCAWLWNGGFFFRINGKMGTVPTADAFRN